MNTLSLSLSLPLELFSLDSIFSTKLYKYLENGCLKSFVWDEWVKGEIGVFVKFAILLPISWFFIEVIQIHAKTEWLEFAYEIWTLNVNVVSECQ